MQTTNDHDPVNHPSHYTTKNIQCGQCGKYIECIDVTRHQNFNLGNAMKYIWRADFKAKPIEDLKKAAWYINDEIKRREKIAAHQDATHIEKFKNSRAAFGCHKCFINFPDEKELMEHMAFSHPSIRDENV